MLEDLVRQAASLQCLLDELRVPCAFIGGIANSVLGEPRTTLDADVLILTADENIGDLVAQLKHHLRLLSPNAASFANRNRVIPCKMPGGLRADLILAKLDFECMLIKRARQRALGKGVKLRICSAEDLIIMKLISIRPKDRGDVEGIVNRQKGKLDASYITKWLRSFEKALDRSNLVHEFRALLRKSHR